MFLGRWEFLLEVERVRLGVERGEEGYYTFQPSKQDLMKTGNCSHMLLVRFHSGTFVVCLLTHSLSQHKLVPTRPLLRSFIAMLLK